MFWQHFLRDAYTDALDVVGYNYKEHLYETDHKRFPGRVIYGSENGHLPEKWTAVQENPYICGQFLWTGVDYMGEAMGWPLRVAMPGLLTMAGFEKASYYQRKALWTNRLFAVLTARPLNKNQKGIREQQQEVFSWNFTSGEPVEVSCYPAKAWYAREGKTLPQAMREIWQERENIAERCDSFGKSLLKQARSIGGEDYGMLVCASYRQAIAAHKLIADAQGEPVFLSKENNSNGCIGTVDVSYPSVPLFLMYNPELVRAMCRPILHFARCPVWKYEYAPHDVGRYPHATGQVYSLKKHDSCGPLCESNGPDGVHPPYYLFSENADVYTEKRQMPIEECGNMLLMLAAAVKADGNDALVRKADDLLCKWVNYLAQYGEDPGEQLCTDDFAGHLAHNVNLAIKAACAVAAYSYLCGKEGRQEDAKKWKKKAKYMADFIVKNANRSDHTSLTLDGDASTWSLKYNAVWDLLFDFGLFEPDWYRREIEWYLTKERMYGIPLDSRKSYTKSDWLLWTAAMSDRKHFHHFCAPVARYLRETQSRVPFSDWYETENGRSVSFIARSVQGGIFMPLLRKSWNISV